MPPGRAPTLRVLTESSSAGPPCPLLCPLIGVDRKWSIRGQNDANDPIATSEPGAIMCRRIGSVTTLSKPGKPARKEWELHKCVVEFHSHCAQFSHFSAALKENHRQDEERLFL